jgi:multidrug efflux system membrane fusion protein
VTRGQRTGLGVVLIVAALGAAGFIVNARVQGQGRDGGGAKGGKGGGDRVVPVVVAHAATRDVPVTLEGLGTVTAYKTVNVRTQVAGRLDKVVFKEGQSVAQGDVLAQVDPRPFEIQLHQAQAARARDSAQLRGAERDLERYEAVVKKQLIPQQQVDDQRALVEQYRGNVMGDDAQIENAKLQLDYARIKSPIQGVTGVRQVDPGNLVNTGDATPIVVVTQLDPITVLFTLPQDDLPRVSPPLRAKGSLPVEALSRDGARTLARGDLLLVDNQINTTTATARLKAVFPNPTHALWPNQFVKARLLVDVRKGVLVIPAVAVQRGPKGTFVYVVQADNTAQARDVTVEATQGDEAIIAKGLAAGETIAVEGQSQLRPGGKVAPRGASGPHP